MARISVNPDQLGYGTIYKYRNSSTIIAWKNKIAKDFREDSANLYWQAYQQHPNRANFLFSFEQKCQMLKKANLQNTNERKAFFKYLENDIEFLKAIVLVQTLPNPPQNQEIDQLALNIAKTLGANQLDIWWKKISKKMQPSDKTQFRSSLENKHPYYFAQINNISMIDLLLKRNHEQLVRPKLNAASYKKKLSEFWDCFQNNFDDYFSSDDELITQLLKEATTEQLCILAKLNFPTIKKAIIEKGYLSKLYNKLDEIDILKDPFTHDALILICAHTSIEKKHTLANQYPQFKSVIYDANNIIQPWAVTPQGHVIHLALTDKMSIAAYVKMLIHLFGKQDFDRALFSGVIYLATQIDGTKNEKQRAQLQTRLKQLLNYNPSFIFGRNIKRRANDYFNNLLFKKIPNLKAAGQSEIVDGCQHQIEAFIKSSSIRNSFELTSKQLYAMAEIPTLNPLCYKVIFSDSKLSQQLRDKNDLYAKRYNQIEKKSPYSNTLGINSFIQDNYINRQDIKIQLLTQIILKKQLDYPIDDALTVRLDHITEQIRRQYNEQINALLEQDTALREEVIKQFTINDVDNIYEYSALLPFIFSNENIEKLRQQPDAIEKLISVIAKLSLDFNNNPVFRYRDKLIELINQTIEVVDGPEKIVNLIIKYKAVFNEILNQQCEAIYLHPKIILHLLPHIKDNPQINTFVANHGNRFYEQLINLRDPGLRESFNALFQNQPELCELFSIDQQEKLALVFSNIKKYYLKKTDLKHLCVLAKQNVCWQQIVLTAINDNQAFRELFLHRHDIDCLIENFGGIAKIIDDACLKQEFIIAILIGHPSFIELLLANKLSDASANFLLSSLDKPELKAKLLPNHFILLMENNDVINDFVTKFDNAFLQEVFRSHDRLESFKKHPIILDRLLQNNAPQRTAWHDQLAQDKFLIGKLFDASITHLESSCKNNPSLLLNFISMDRCSIDFIKNHAELIIKTLSDLTYNELNQLNYDPVLSKLLMSNEENIIYFIFSTSVLFQKVKKANHNNTKIQADINQIVNKVNIKTIEDIFEILAKKIKHPEEVIEKLFVSATPQLLEQAREYLTKATNPNVFHNNLFSLDEALKILNHPKLIGNHQSHSILEKNQPNKNDPIRFQPTQEDKTSLAYINKINKKYNSWLENNNKENNSWVFGKIMSFFQKNSVDNQIKSYLLTLAKLNKKIAGYNEKSRLFSANIAIMMSLIIINKIQALHMMKIKLDYDIVHQYIKNHKQPPPNILASLSGDEKSKYLTMAANQEIYSYISCCIDEKKIPVQIIRNNLTPAQCTTYKEDLANYETCAPVNPTFRSFLITFFLNDGLACLAENKMNKDLVQTTAELIKALLENMEALYKVAVEREEAGLYLTAIEYCKKIINEKYIVESRTTDETILNSLDILYLKTQLKLLELYVHTTPSNSTNRDLSTRINIILRCDQLPENYFESLSDCLYNDTIYHAISKKLSKTTPNITNNIKNLLDALSRKRDTFSKTSQERLDDLRCKAVIKAISLAKAIEEEQYYQYASNLLLKIYQDNPDYFYKKLQIKKRLYIPAQVVLATKNNNLIALFLREPRLSLTWVQGDEKDRQALCLATTPSSSVVAQSLCLYQHLFIAGETQPLMNMLDFDNTYSQKVIAKRNLVIAREENKSAPMMPSPIMLSSPPIPSTLDMMIAPPPPPPPPSTLNMPPPPPLPPPRADVIKKHVSSNNKSDKVEEKKPSAIPNNSHTEELQTAILKAAGHPQKKSCGLPTKSSTPAAAPPAAHTPPTFKFSEFLGDTSGNRTNYFKFIKTALDITRDKVSENLNARKIQVIEDFVRNVITGSITLEGCQYSQISYGDIDNFIRKTYEQFKGQQTNPEKIAAVKDIAAKKEFLVENKKEIKQQEESMLHILISKFQCYHHNQHQSIKKPPPLKNHVNDRTSKSTANHGFSQTCQATLFQPKNDKNDVKEVLQQHLIVQGLSDEELKYIESQLYDSVKDLQKVQAILEIYMKNGIMVSFIQRNTTPSSSNNLARQLEKAICLKEKEAFLVDRLKERRQGMHEDEEDEDNTNWEDEDIKETSASKKEIALPESLQPLNQYLKPLKTEDMQKLVDRLVAAKSRYTSPSCNP